MVAACLYFQVHQPHRLRRYRVFDIGRSGSYFDDDLNRRVMDKVAAKCYLPANALLGELIERHEGRFRVAFSISGAALEQFERYAPEVLDSFQALSRTGCVELLAETAFHSLSFVHDRQEFDRQVDEHVETVERLFGRRPAVFRNTELIFNNDLARHLQHRGFASVLAEGADRVLQWRSPNFLYTARGAPGIKVLLKNYRLSDDVAFRYSDRAWAHYPLLPQTFAGWLGAANGGGEVVNLFMDYETFGEHQWAESGIFEFLRALPAEVLAHPDNTFRTPSEVVASLEPAAELDVPDFTSWADAERDLSAWLGNPMQRAAAEALYRLGPLVRESGDESLLAAWRRLTTSDHFYYMCTKHFSDGDVHKYFNPYDSPYEGYISFMNVLNDLALRAGSRALSDLVLSESPAELAAAAAG